MCRFVIFSVLNFLFSLDKYITFLKNCLEWKIRDILIGWYIYLLLIYLQVVLLSCYLACIEFLYLTNTINHKNKKSLRMENRKNFDRVLNFLVNIVINEGNQMILISWTFILSI